MVARLILISILLVACVGSAQPEDDMKRLGPAQMGSITNAVSRKFNTRSNDSMSVQTPNFETSANYTVKFNLTLPPVLTQAQAKLVAQANAVIEASVGGVTTYRRVSIMNGMSVTVVAEKVRVVVTDNSKPVSGAAADYVYDISCMIGEGVRPTVNQPPILIPTFIAGNGSGNFPGATGSIGPGQSATWGWSDDSGVISLFVALQPGGPLANSDIYIEEQTSRGDANGSTTATLAFFSPLLQPGWVPIAPGTNQIIIHNQASVVGTNYSLFLGVDG